MKEENEMYALHFVSSFVITHHVAQFFVHVAQLSVHLHNFLFTRVTPQLDDPLKSIELFNRAIKYQKRSVATADKRPFGFGIRPTEMRREASGLRHSSDVNVAPTIEPTRGDGHRGLTSANPKPPISPTVLPHRDGPRDLVGLSCGSDVLTSIAVTPIAVPAG